ncbi:MAG: iron chelate uptake ABC transporter family permease subunit [Bacteroidota bacterium]
MINQYFEESRSKWIKILAGLGFLGFVCFFLNIGLGSVNIPLKSLINYLLGDGAGKESWDLILTNFRIPKALTAVFVGSALGVSGLQMQTLFRNPLAGPYILGISSGAGLGVALVIFLGFYLGGAFDLSGIGRSWLIVLAAGLGSFVVLLVIAVVATRIKDSVSLLIIGLMFGTASSALVSILQFFSQAENIQAYVLWSFGNLGSLSWMELSIFIPVVTSGLVASILLSKRLNALLLGENYAKSLGLNIRKTRLLIILNTSILAGTVTAFCGPIAFFGVALPHLTRMLFNTSNHLLLTPVLILFGASLMLIFDAISQLPGLGATLPINAVTSLIGAPFVVYLLIRKKNLGYSFNG